MGLAARLYRKTRTNFLANPITLHLHQTFYFFKTPSISFYFNLQYILSDFITSPWGIERVYITICNHTLPILKMVKLRNVSAMYSYIDRDQASSDKPLPGIKPTALLICIFSPVQFSSVQLLSRVWLFETPWTAAHQACLSITNCQSLLKLMSIESVMLSNHLILLSPSPPAFNLSQHQGLFKWVSSLHQEAKVLDFQLQHQSFQWIFRTDFL